LPSPPLLSLPPLTSLLHLPFLPSSPFLYSHAFAPATARRSEKVLCCESNSISICTASAHKTQPFRWRKLQKEAHFDGIQCRAGASLNETPPPRTTTIGPQFSGDPFLVVTLQNNNRHTSARAQKIFPTHNTRPLSIREAPDRGYGGLSTGSVDSTPT